MPLVGAAGEAVQKIGETHPRTFIETLVHIFPASVVDSLVRGDILQIVAFAVLFAMAVSAIGEKGRPMLVAMESLSQVMFKLTNYVMRFAPFGVAAAMAHTIGTQGPGVLISLGNLIVSYYAALILFVVLIFGIIMFVARVPIGSSCAQCASRQRSRSPRPAANLPCPKRCRQWNASACPDGSWVSSCRRVTRSILTAR